MLLLLVADVHAGHYFVLIFSCRLRVEMYEDLLPNVHLDLSPPGEKVLLVKGDYLYFHYICDGVDDRVSISRIYAL